MTDKITKARSDKSSKKFAQVAKKKILSTSETKKIQGANTGAVTSRRQHGM